jgi:hypothetical protein
VTGSIETRVHFCEISSHYIAVLLTLPVETQDPPFENIVCVTNTVGYLSYQPGKVNLDVWNRG